MSKKSAVLLPLLLVALFFAGCKDNNQPEKKYKELMLSASSVSVRPGDYNNVGIVAGNGSYNVTSENSNVADASIKGDSVRVRGVNVGETSIIVFDLKSETHKEIHVKVLQRIPLIEIDKSIINLVRGDSDIVKIVAGSGSYNLEFEHPEVASAKLIPVGNITEVHLMGTKQGNTLLYITDKQTDAKKVVNISVQEPIADVNVDKPNVNMMVHETTKVKIIAGSGNYQVSSNDGNVATAVLSGDKMTIAITAVAKGDAKIAVYDVKSGKIKNINVHVVPFADAHSFVEEGIKYGFLDTKTVEVVANKYSGNITIPAMVEHNGVMYKVVSIGESAFEGARQLKSVNLPEGIVAIKAKAFMNCSNMKSCNIPSTVESLGYLSFAACGLTSMRLPAGLKEIAGTDRPGLTDDQKGFKDESFLEWTGLSSLTIDPSNRYFGVKDNILYSKTGEDREVIAYATKCNIKNVALPSGVKNIRMYAFAGTSNMSSVLIPNSVENIYDRAFQSCPALNKIQIGAQVDDNYLWVGRLCFSYCPSLKKIICYKSSAPETGYSFVLAYDAYKDPDGTKQQKFLDNLQLIIPRGALADYQDESGYSRWFTIKHISAEL